MKQLILAGCVLVKEEAILLLYRTKKDWFELPGGKKEENETLEEAAKRELREELLCDVHIGRTLGKTTFQQEDLHITYTWFLAEIDAHQTPRIGEPHTFRSFAYIPLQKLHQYPLSPNMKKFHEALQQGLVTLS